MRIIPCGLDGLLIEFRSKIRLSVHRRVLRLADAIDNAGIRGVQEAIPSYCSLLLRYEPLTISFSELSREIRILKGRIGPETVSEKNPLYIPVLYGGAAGPDLVESAKACHLSPEQLITKHLSTVYRVYAIGFLPGFPYLGLLPKKLSLPRLETPRKRVAKGSVAIANRQTGIYPRESPGGWRLIGRTPFELFNGSEDPPTLFQTGDTVRFVAVDETEFENIRARVARGNWMRYKKNWGQITE